MSHRYGMLPVANPAHSKDGSEAALLGFIRASCFVCLPTPCSALYRKSEMKTRSTILLGAFSFAVSAAIALWMVGRSPVPVILLWVFVSLLVFVFWDTVPPHKRFSYQDQQRAMRAFDRSDLIDAGKPYWAKDKPKRKKIR